MKIRRHLILAADFNVDLVDELCEEYPELDYLYCDSFLRFYGTPERLQEIFRACKAKGIKFKDS